MAWEHSTSLEKYTNMKYLLPILLLIPFLSFSQKVERDFTATITFGSFSAVNDSTFQGDITINDQTNTYDGNDVAVGQRVFTSSGRMYRVSAVNSQALFTANVDLIDIQDSNYAFPSGIGQIFTKTTNYGFSLYTPDNANGISQQAKSILESHNWLFLDSILLSGLAADGNIAISDLDMTSNRTLNGMGSFSLTIDSVPAFRLNATEVFITDDSTNATTIIGTTTKYGKENAGYSRVNSLGLDFLYFQNTNGSDEFHRLSIDEESLGLSSKRKEVVGNASYGSEATFDPDFLDFNMSDSLLASRAKIRLARDKITITAPDSLVLDIGAETYDEDLSTVLAIDTDTKRLYYKTVSAGAVAYDTYSSGAVSTTASRFGGTAIAVTNPGSGQYRYTIPASTNVMEIDFDGNNTNLDGSAELSLIIDNSANSRDRFFTVQIIEKSGNSHVNQFATGTRYIQTVAGNVTTIKLAQLSGYSSAGYKIMLR